MFETMGIRADYTHGNKGKYTLMGAQMELWCKHYDYISTRRLYVTFLTNMSRTRHPDAP